ncbi:MAG: urea transporter [Bacteroidetes bacterium]|nr:urea transporter [Bacteroidota bacterium]
MNISSTNLKNYYKSVINSYAQIFFTKNKILGIILLIVSFFDFWTGIGGLVAVIITNISANLINFSKFNIETGLYGFNSLLVGLAAGITFEPGLHVLIIIFFLSILTLFITIAFEGFLYKYSLPFLSIPFLLVAWMINLSAGQLELLGLSQRGIYLFNDLFSLGGQNLVDIYNFIEAIPIFQSLKIYFLSLAAIIFQFNVLAGILISIGLLLSSRIAFTLSFLGFYTAYLFYNFIGVDFNELSYTFIGFNYILTAIAIGGFFLIPSKSTYFWVVLLLPVTVLITFGFNKIFINYQLPIYSLPFNVISLIFLYTLKLRMQKGKELVEPLIQFNSPEKNLYSYKNNLFRFSDIFYYPVYLPVLGDWTISQGHKGEYTHKNEWQHAWDLTINDDNGNQYQSKGDYCKDYYCYEKPVISPADGIIVEIIDGIDDNLIGDINTLNNWGNSLTIKHTEYLYSQLSHIKPETFKVKKGELVKKGQTLALCGNSGRSPYPHLHFQLQATPFIGSQTIDYSIAHYMQKNNSGYKLKSFSKPEKNQTISNIQTNSLLKNALHFIPGQTIKFNVVSITKDGKTKKETISWDVETDIYNNTYINCKKSGSFAYLKNDGLLHYFTYFEGDKKSFLYYFFLSLYKVELGFYEGLSVNDRIPPNIIFNKKNMFLQDFIAPFKIFLNAHFSMNYISIDDDFSPSKIKLVAKTELKIFNKTKKTFSSDICINDKGVNELNISFDKTQIKATCIN